MKIKYWMWQPEKMLIVDLPEEYEKDKSYISVLLVGAYSLWMEPEESYDEETVEEIYDTPCEVFIMNELQKELGYKLNWSVSKREKEKDADYVLMGF